MAVTLKKKPKKAVETAAAQTEMSEIDQLIFNLKVAYEPYYALKDQFTELEKVYKEAEVKFLDYVDAQLAPEKKTKAQREGIVVEVQPKGVVTTVSNKELLIDMLEGVQEDLPFDLAKFSLTDLKKYLDQTALDKVTTKERTKKRVVKITLV